MEEFRTCRRRQGRQALAEVVLHLVDLQGTDLNTPAVAGPRFTAPAESPEDALLHAYGVYVPTMAGESPWRDFFLRCSPSSRLDEDELPRL